MFTVLALSATLSSVAFGQTAMFSVKQLANIPGATQGRAVVWHGTVPSPLPQNSKGAETSAAYAVNDAGLELAVALVSSH